MAAGCINRVLDSKISIRILNPRLTDIHLSNWMIGKWSWPLLCNSVRGSIRIGILSRRRNQLLLSKQGVEPSFHWGNWGSYSKNVYTYLESFQLGMFNCWNNSKRVYTFMELHSVFVYTFMEYSHRVFTLSESFQVCIYACGIFRECIIRFRNIFLFRIYVIGIIPKLNIRSWNNIN